MEEVFARQRRHRRGGLGVVIALVLLAACDPGFTMKGEVVDAAGRPIANARVELAIGLKAVSLPVLANCTHPYVRDTCTEVTVHVTLR